MRETKHPRVCLARLYKDATANFMAENEIGMRPVQRSTANNKAGCAAAPLVPTVCHNPLRIQVAPSTHKQTGEEYPHLSTNAAIHLLFQTYGFFQDWSYVPEVNPHYI
jgi:hypothetical protein